MIPDHIKDKILSKVSLVDIMEREGIQFVRKGRQYMALCPFHKERTPSFSVNNEEGVYYCFGCHAKGNAITFLKEYKHLSFIEAMEYLARLANEDISLYLSGGTKSEERRQDYISFYQQAVDFYAKNLWSSKGEKAREYLFSRGLNEETIKKFRMGYSSDPREIGEYLHSRGFSYAQMVKWGLLGSYEHRDRFAGRILFPIYDREGYPIAFGGRIFGTTEGVKYLNSPETPWFKKSDVLYGFFHAKDTLVKEKKAILVEGYMDVLSLHQAGITSAVAPLGTALTEAHLQLLQRYVDKVILLFDGDSAGLQAASRSLDILIETNMESGVVILPQNMDPDEMILEKGKDAFLQFLEHEIQSPLQFKWMYIREYQLKEQPLNKHLEEMFQFLSKISQPVAQHEAIVSLAALVNLNPNILYEDFRRYLQKRKNFRGSSEQKDTLVALQQESVAEEYERTLLAMLIKFPDKTALEMIESMITPEMFTNERYREWFYYLIENKPTMAIMYEKVAEDDALCKKIAEPGEENVTPEKFMELIYTFYAYYVKRKSQECTLKLQQAQKQQADADWLKTLYTEKTHLEEELQKVRQILDELHQQVWQ
ncbi:DNA primase [Thermospira aquatica]|uniref:DNA primase n=1 Tax=Thermospira aquatica TaxID=2828656 RepID=A0AAX3BCH8_9SPIR|nr:DNA primase [Thermospira aquatica]URA09836.1 DNA primase [Thermospira aquatica]